LEIPDGGQGRFRVTASDGLRWASATSFQFQIANQPPQVYIDTALNSGAVLEGQSVSLRANAFDGEDGPLDGASVRWDSNRDGTIGTGAALSTTALSVGPHAITVWAFDHQGWANSATIHLTVLGDYDFDGIDDEAEAASALNLLSSTDAYSDADGDGLTLRVERQIGSNPASADSDGDGRRDDREFVDGTSSTTVDTPPAPDALFTTLSDLSLLVDLAADTPLPQFNLGVFSRQSADWQLITDVDWLEATQAGGTTPATTLVRVQVFNLPDGVHQARLRFDSTTIGDSPIIPITVTVANRRAYFDVDGSGNADATDCQTVEALVGRTFGQAGYDLDLDLDRDGVIESSDVGTCNAAVGSTPLPGDFDHDGDQDANDIDLFIAAPFIDFNSDAQLDSADSRYLIEEIFHTHFGDANLDGLVNRTDATIVTANLGWSAGPAWARGNFNGDARVDLVDLAMQQANFGFGPAPSPAAAVFGRPERASAAGPPRGDSLRRLAGARRIAAVKPTEPLGPSAGQSVISAERNLRSHRASRQRVATAVDELFAV
jgi:hypothetical protein